MPELPEVETTRRGIELAIQQQVLEKLIVRNHNLRWPVPSGLDKLVCGQTVQQISRRAKYLLIELEHGTIILHLGMSGYLRLLPADTPLIKHDHIDLVFASGSCLRFNDARRFGSLHWTTDDPNEHPLLNHLGPEPLTRHFSARYLHRVAQKRKTAIKTFIGDNKIVVGVGNIYASESLFLAGIHPEQAAQTISLERYQDLVKAIKLTLRKAIKAGGTTLKDFRNSEGKPGYFKQQLQVYGRSGEHCYRCDSIIRDKIINGRRAFYCAGCQR
jgi:formamidopyrimidine-DNA glycosylase